MEFWDDEMIQTVDENWFGWLVAVVLSERWIKAWSCFLTFVIYGIGLFNLTVSMTFILYFLH